MNQPKKPPLCLNGLSEHLQLDLFRALSDPSRLALLTRLAFIDEPQSVSEIASCCGVHITGASRHLKILREAGLVVADKRGREVVYQPSFSKCIRLLRSLADAMDVCMQTDDDTDIRG